jgi:hypothetical protein
VWHMHRVPEPRKRSGNFQGTRILAMCFNSPSAVVVKRRAISFCLKLLVLVNEELPLDLGLGPVTKWPHLILFWLLFWFGEMDVGFNTKLAGRPSALCAKWWRFWRIIICNRVGQGGCVIGQRHRRQGQGHYALTSNFMQSRVFTLGDGVVPWTAQPSGQNCARIASLPSSSCEGGHRCRF